MEQIVTSPRKRPLLARLYSLLGSRIPTQTELRNEPGMKRMVKAFLAKRFVITDLATPEKLAEQRKRIEKTDFSWLNDDWKPSVLSRLATKAGGFIEEHKILTGLACVALVCSPDIVSAVRDTVQNRTPVTRQVPPLQQQDNVKVNGM